MSLCMCLIVFCRCVGLPCCKQLVQVIINTTHLEQSCHFLEEFISNITNVPPDTVNTTKLYGTSTFKVPDCFSLQLRLFLLFSVPLLSKLCFSFITFTHC